MKVDKKFKVACGKAWALNEHNEGFDKDCMKCWKRTAQGMAVIIEDQRRAGIALGDALLENQVKLDKATYYSQSKTDCSDCGHWLTIYGSVPR